MSIWHFQPQEWQTLSTSKEKTRKGAVGQEHTTSTLPLPGGLWEQPQKVSVQSTGPKPAPRAPATDAIRLWSWSGLRLGC